MRFVFVTPELSPLVPGGAGAVVAETAQRLAATHEVVVILVTETPVVAPGTLPYRLVLAEVPPADGTREWYLERSRRAAFALAAVAAEGGPIDLVEFTDFEALGWWALTHRDDLGLQRVRLGVRLHGPGEAITAAVGCDTPLLQRLGELERVGFAMADVVIVPSGQQGEWAVDRYGIDPARVVVSTPPVAVVSPRPRRRSPTPTLVAFGRLSEQKGVDLLVDAVIPVLDAHPDARLVFIGSDGWSLCRQRPMSEVLRATIPDRHRSRVEFRGRMERAAALDALASAWAVVNTSRYETFCLALHEARRAGAPVVASDLAVFAGFDGHGVVTYDGTAPGLSTILDRLIADPAVLDSLAAEPPPVVADGLPAYLSALPDPHHPTAQSALATAALQKVRTPRREGSVMARVLHLVPARVGRLAVRIVPRRFKEWLRWRASWPAEVERRNAAERRRTVANRIRAGDFPEAGEPDISVVIPCFDQGRWVEDAVLSVFEQSHRSWEIVLVDDGSTDPESVEVLDRLGRWPRVAMLRQSNRGLPAARNAGMAAARGKYLVPLDGDDELEPEFLATLLGTLAAHPDAAYAHCWGRYFGDLDAYWLTRPFNRFQMLLSNSVLGCVLLRREAWAAVGGYDETLTGGNEDWDLWLRLLAAGQEQVQVRRPLFRYRVHGETMSVGTLSRFEAERVRLAARHRDLYSSTAAAKTAHYPLVTVLRRPGDGEPAGLEDCDRAELGGDTAAIDTALYATRGKFVVELGLLADPTAATVTEIALSIEANPDAECVTINGVPVAWRRWVLHDPAAPPSRRIEVEASLRPGAVPMLARGIAPRPEWMVPMELASSGVRVIRQPPEVEGALPDWFPRGG